MGQILGIANQDGEIIEFENGVGMSTSIERCLRQVEQEMRLGVACTLQQCFHDFNYTKEEFIIWIKKWPTQLLLVVLEIVLTNQLKDIFK